MVRGGTFKINRAPVLTLWAAVVAQRLGFKRDEALSLAKAVAGLTAQSKGQRLGIFMKPEKSAAEAKKQKQDVEFMVPLLGRGIPSMRTDEGVRAVAKDKPVEPESVGRYLASKFGDDLDRVESAMAALAQAMSRKELAERAFDLYAEFRPAIPSGTAGWGAKGVLDITAIRKMAG